jgi:hypothetical protein
LDKLFKNFNYFFLNRGADYKRIAPPHSFIDALSFNPKELADHLLKLEKDEKHYFRHFWWKDVYKVTYTKLITIKLSVYIYSGRKLIFRCIRDMENWLLDRFVICARN